MEMERRQFRDKVGKLLNYLDDIELTKPPVSSRYPEIASKLLTFDREGVRTFNGGPLDFREYGIDKSWLTPVEVEDRDGWTNFHIIFLNCAPVDAANVPVEISYARNVGLKVGDVRDSSVGYLHRIIMGGDKTPRVIVRPSLIGSLYYPKISTTLDMPTPETLAHRIVKLKRVLKLNFDTDNISKNALNGLTRGFELYAEYPQFYMGMPEQIYSEAGLINKYPIVSPDDPWKYFQLFTNKPLEKINKLPPIVLRTDSGCDAGQLYRDLGCDCRDQFITALKAIHRGDENDLGGIVVHIPTQDGRGYGMNTKMETEGIKRGMAMVFNGQDENIEPSNTIKAAQKVFDEDYDVRTYDGTARILFQIGFRSVIVYTDNVDKVACLRRGGLEVERRPTDTQGNKLNNHHIHAKHQTQKYFHKE